MWSRTGRRRWSHHLTHGRLGERAAIASVPAWRSHADAAVDRSVGVLRRIVGDVDLVREQEVEQRRAVGAHLGDEFVSVRWYLLSSGGRPFVQAPPASNSATEPPKNWVRVCSSRSPSRSSNTAIASSDPSGWGSPDATRSLRRRVVDRRAETVHRPHDPHPDLTLEVLARLERQARPAVDEVRPERPVDRRVEPLGEAGHPVRAELGDDDADSVPFSTPFLISARAPTRASAVRTARRTPR